MLFCIHTKIATIDAQNDFLAQVRSFDCNIDIPQATKVYLSHTDVFVKDRICTECFEGNNKASDYFNISFVRFVCVIHTSECCYVLYDLDPVLTLASGRRKGSGLVWCSCGYRLSFFGATQCFSCNCHQEKK